MITIIPVKKMLTIIAIIYALMLLPLTLLLKLDILDSALAVFRGAFFLEMAIIFLFAFGWRKLWAIFPSLNRLVYPDLNGVWFVSIYYKRGRENGVKNAKAYIKQDFLRISMELVSDESESETLMVTAKKDPESSRPFLYYIYRNEPKQGIGKSLPPHKGAAILKLDHDDSSILKGNYFTDRATSGRFELRREI